MSVLNQITHNLHFCTRGLNLKIYITVIHLKVSQIHFTATNVFFTFRLCLGIEAETLGGVGGRSG